jgi:hypothetical protein
LDYISADAHRWAGCRQPGYRRTSGSSCNWTWLRVSLYWFWLCSFSQTEVEQPPFPADLSQPHALRGLREKLGSNLE